MDYQYWQWLGHMCEFLDIHADDIEGLIEAKTSPSATLAPTPNLWASPARLPSNIVSLTNAKNSLNRIEGDVSINIEWLKKLVSGDPGNPLPLPEPVDPDTYFSDVMTRQKSTRQSFGGICAHFAPKHVQRAAPNLANSPHFVPDKQYLWYLNQWLEKIATDLETLFNNLRPYPIPLGTPRVDPPATDYWPLLIQIRDALGRMALNLAFINAHEPDHALAVKQHILKPKAPARRNIPRPRART